MMGLEDHPSLQLTTLEMHCILLLDQSEPCKYQQVELRDPARCLQDSIL